MGYSLAAKHLTKTLDPCSSSHITAHLQACSKSVDKNPYYFDWVEENRSNEPVE